ncbi:MAG: hypothetical protein ACO34E_04615 [Limisphaerales bacterium]|jgi:hypothetical protein
MGTTRELQYPDKHFVNSAAGWLELGNHTAALEEAKQISIFGRVHQDGFLIYWRIAARSGNWQQALEMSQVYTKACSAKALGWICLSYSLYRLKRPLDAWMKLLPKLREFPKIAAIPYILACYASELGNKTLADRLLQHSASLGGPSEIRGQSLDTAYFERFASDDKPAEKTAPAKPSSQTSRIQFPLQN